MSQGERVPLGEAEPVARALAALLGPSAERVLVGGSVRRQRATVGDLEVIVLCKVDRVARAGQQVDLFAPKVLVADPVNRTHSLLDEWVGQPAEWEPPETGGLHLWLRRGERWGPKYRGLFVDWYERSAESSGWPLKLDLFMTEVPGSFGWLSVIRTGPKDFNLWLLERLRAAGVTADGGRLYRGAGAAREVIETPEEADVFGLFGGRPPAATERSMRDGESQHVSFGRWNVLTAEGAR